MSAETDFQALLAGNAALDALVDGRIALNAPDDETTYPLVVFSVSHSPVVAMDGAQVADQCSITVECWAESAVAADAVANAVVAAVATAPVARGAVPTARQPSFDPQLGLDSTSLTFDWWA